MYICNQLAFFAKSNHAVVALKGLYAYTFRAPNYVKNNYAQSKSYYVKELVCRKRMSWELDVFPEEAIILLFRIFILVLHKKGFSFCLSVPYPVVLSPLVMLVFC